MLYEAISIPSSICQPLSQKSKLKFRLFSEVGKSNLTSLFCEEKKKLGQVIVPYCTVGDNHLSPKIFFAKKSRNETSFSEVGQKSNFNIDFLNNRVEMHGGTRWTVQSTARALE